MDLFNWPFAVSVIAVCYTIYNVIQLKLRHDLKLEALRNGQLEVLLEVETYE